MSIAYPDVLSFKILPFKVSLLIEVNYYVCSVGFHIIAL